MKKFKFISAIALTVLMASCDDFDLPNPPGQTNGEPTGIFEAGDMVITPATAAIDLKADNAANVNAKVGEITKLINFPADYELVVEMEVSGNDSFNPCATIATTVEPDSVIGVNPDVLNGAIQEVISKEPKVAPAAYDVHARFVGYAVKGNTKLRLGSLTQTYGTEVLKVSTLDPAKVIEDTYYLIPCGADGKPDFSKKLQMNNTSGAGVSPYDNPEFAIKIDVPEDQAENGYLWMVASQSAVTAGDAAQLLGCIPAEGGMSGKLAAGLAPGAIHLQGPVLVTVNVEEDSYSVSYALEFLYPLSGATLSKPENAMLIYPDSNFINYTGVSMLNGVYYICAQASYREGTVFRQDDELGFEDSEDGMTRTGFLTAKSAGSQLRTPVSKAHLYWMNVNLVQQTYSITCLETLTVIGGGNGWDLESAAALAPNKDFSVWEAEDVVIGDEFKINANRAWEIDFGGVALENEDGKQVYNISYKGGNLQAKPGTYKVTVDFRTVPYTVTLE